MKARTLWTGGLALSAMLVGAVGAVPALRAEEAKSAAVTAATETVTLKIDGMN